MYELRYKITDEDINELNVKSTRFYVLLYGITALVGVAVGLVAALLGNQKMLEVLGWALVALGGVLLLLALVLAVAPKTTYPSAIKTGDGDITVTVDTEEYKIIAAGNEDKAEIAFSQIVRVKEQYGNTVVYAGKDGVLIIKDSVVSGGTIAQLTADLSAMRGMTAPYKPQE